MSAHTQGPWDAEDTTFGFVVEDPSGKEIADISGAYHHRDEFTANARLVAAAPDLLRELRSMLEGHGCWAEEICDSCDPARAAIAKATGEEVPE